MSEKLISRFFDLPDSHTLKCYLAEGGYEAAKKVFRDFTPEAVVEAVKKSNLRGLGGAGFPCGVKWSFVPKGSTKPVYLAVNGDEGEPGTFKDRAILAEVPHLLIEGILITCYAVGIHKAYVYLRGEYEFPTERFQAAVQEAYDNGFLGKKIFGRDFDLELVIHRGAGAYICGEESAMLESIEGKKGFPRLKPPFPAVVGLFGCPTVINNVETLAYLRFIVERGPEWFASLGVGTNGGMRLFSVSGHVERPGLYELPLKTPLREIIYDHAGGILNGNKLKAVVPGGLSSAVLAPNEIDVKMDFDSLKAAGSMGGSGGVVVMDETTCVVKALTITMRFFAHESCGQCSPCREGTGWVYKILNRIETGRGRKGDIEHLLDIGSYMTGTTICAFADGAAGPLLSYPRKFRDEFEYHIRERRCLVGQEEVGVPRAVPSPSMGEG